MSRDVCCGRWWGESRIIGTQVAGNSISKIYDTNRVSLSKRLLLDEESRKLLYRGIWLHLDGPYSPLMLLNRTRRLMAINLIFGRVSLIADDYSQVASRRWRVVGGGQLGATLVL
jgi:hypothetical protein